MPGVGTGRHRQDVPLWDGRRGSVVPSGGRRHAAATLIVRGLRAASVALLANKTAEEVAKPELMTA